MRQGLIEVVAVARIRSQETHYLQVSMSNITSYRLWIYGRDEMHDPEFIKNLISLGITPSRANAITKAAYCLGLCILKKGTLEQMEELHDTLAAKGYRSKIDFRDTPHPNSTIC